MKNIEHKILWENLVNLRVNVKFLVRHSVDLKNEILDMEYNEERLKKIKQRNVYRGEIEKTNREIRETKLKIRKCQREFGQSDSGK